MALMKEIPPNFCMMAASDNEEGIESCKQYVRENGWTKDDVKISRTSDNMVVVVSKKAIPLRQTERLTEEKQ